MTVFAKAKHFRVFKVWMNHAHKPFCKNVTHKAERTNWNLSINHVCDYIISVLNWMTYDWLTWLSVCPSQTATCLSATMEEPVRRPCTLRTTFASVLQATVGLSVRSVSARTKSLIYGTASVMANPSNVSCLTSEVGSKVSSYFVPSKSPKFTFWVHAILVWGSKCKPRSLGLAFNY